MFPLPLVVTIVNSGRLRLYLACAHIICAVAISYAELLAAFQWAGQIFLVLSLAYHLRQDRSIRLRGDANGKFEVWWNGEWRVARLTASSVIWPGYTVLRYAFGSELRIRQLVVLPDCLSAVEFRRLRVWLRWRGNKHELMKQINPDQ